MRQHKPNAETIAAIEAAERGETICCKTLEDYLKLVAYPH